MKREVFIIGAGGHSKVIANVINKSGDIVKGFLDDYIEVGTVIIKKVNYKVIGRIEDIIHLQIKYPNAEFIIGIGNNKIRKEIAEKYEEILKFYTAIDPSSQIALDVEIGEMTHIGSGAIVKNNIKICNNCTIGAGAVVVKNIDESGVYAGVPVKRLK